MTSPSHNTNAASNARYGTLFVIVAVLLCVPVATRGGWYWLCLWPAVAFVGPSLAYFSGNARIFGKKSDGTLAAMNVVFLLPVIAVLTIVFHLARLLSREPAHHALSDGILIGRRLLSHELPSHVNAVVDLTSEFAEPRALRERCYHSFPILDSSVPAEAKLHEWLRQTDAIDGTIYIHCAQGHGRTALFAACLLLHRGLVATADEALALIQSRRPLTRLNSTQTRFLRDVAPRVVRPPGSTA